MEPGFKHIVRIPLFAKRLTCISEAQAPGKRTEKRVSNESSQVHFRDSGRKRDECSDHWQQPAAEDYQLTPAGEPSFGEVQIVLRDQNVAAIFFDDATSAVHADPIRYDRSNHATGGTGNRHGPQIESPRVDQITGEWQDDL